MDKYRQDGSLFVGGVSMIADDMISFIKSDLKVFGTAAFSIDGAHYRCHLPQVLLGTVDDADMSNFHTLDRRTPWVAGLGSHRYQFQFYLFATDNYAGDDHPPDGALP